MKNDFDVIIVGARCAGAATALLLARAGVRVLVIDKTAYGSDTLSTHALMRGAVMQLHRWGVLPHVQRAATPAVRTTLFDYGEQQVVVNIEPKNGVDALYAPRRTVLDRALVDKARDAGAEFAFRTHVTDLMKDETGRVIGVMANTGDGIRVWRADLVIGADGLHSEVAKRTGASQTVDGQHTAATLFTYWEGMTAAGYEWHYGARGSVGVIPTNNDAVCVFVAIPAADLNAAVRPSVTSGYERLLRHRFPQFAARLEGARQIERVRGFGGHRGFMKRAAGPGWALVGDAGYFKDPLTAHGITDALRDAELLARAVLENTADAFANYATTRHDLSRRLFHVTDRIASFEWTIDELQALHREFSREMSREQSAIAQLEPFAWQLPSVSTPVGA